MTKNAVEPVTNQTSVGFYNQLFLVPKPNNRWRPILDLSNLNKYLKTQSFKMETPETIRTSLQTGEWVTSIDFKDAYFHIPIQSQSKKYMHFHKQDKAYHFKALSFGLSTAHGVHCSGQRGQVSCTAKGYKNPPVPRRLVGHSQIPPNLSPTYKDTNIPLSGIRLASEQREIRTGTETSIRFCRLPVRPEGGQGQTHVGTLADLADKNKRPSDRSVCPVRKLMSSIGLLTATEKQVHLGRLHMRPIQWHLKNNWRVPESLDKQIPIPKSLHTHLKWWLEEDNVLQSQPLHPPRHALQIFTDTSKEGWGAHLNEHTARGTWSLPESQLHINYLELKSVFLALKQFQDLCLNNLVLIATDNTTVVAYINKEGGMKSGPLCALLWRILTWCTRRQVTLRARHIPSRLNVTADKLSRLRQPFK